MGQDAGHGASLPLAQLGRPRGQGHCNLFTLILILCCMDLARIIHEASALARFLASGRG